MLKDSSNHSSLPKQTAVAKCGVGGSAAAARVVGGGRVGLLMYRGSASRAGNQTTESYASRVEAASNPDKVAQ
jgi:hypothetical protein